MGVHYDADHGYGLSYATVQIYVHGVLAFESADKLLDDTGRFWDVAVVDWCVSVVDMLHDGFP